MPKIKVVGHSTLYELDEIKDTIIYLGGRYYFKHDSENLIKVTTPSGYRLYRKESPLVCKTANGTFAKKTNCILTEDGLYLEKLHPDTVKLTNGKFTHRKWTVQIDGKYYLKTDESIVKDYVTGRYVPKNTTVKLCEKYYGKEANVVFSPDLYTYIKDELVITEDTREVLSWDKETNSRQTKILFKKDVGDYYRNNVFKGFKDSSNPQIDRYDFAYAKSSDVVSVSIGRGFYVLKEEEASVLETINTLMLNENERHTAKVRDLLNSKFSDLDSSENTAKIISSDYQTWPGKHRIYGSSSGFIVDKASRVGLTGGIGYGFGVEIETSAGLVDSSSLNRLKFLAVGDRSIGAAEYVTPVLHGNGGIEYLEKLFKLVNSSCFVDDRCSIHVHVGPSPGEGINHWNLKFNQQFAINSIRLGCLLEQELYQILPKSRNPYNRHCHSIRRFDNISKENWREYLGAFVFGPQENWKSTLDFRNYKYGENGFTKSNELSNWCGGRYKWLNLVRAYSSCSSPTIEIRIWSPTTNFDKAYNYILLSLAFVRFADVYTKEIGVATVLTLEDVIKTVYKKYPKIIKRLLEFIAIRKEKFGRKNVYTSIKVEDIKTVTTSLQATPIFDLSE